MRTAEMFTEVRTVRFGRMEVVPRDNMSRLLEKEDGTFFIKKGAYYEQ